MKFEENCGPGVSEEKSFKGVDDGGREERMTMAGKWSQ